MVRNKIIFVVFLPVVKQTSPSSKKDDEISPVVTLNFQSTYSVVSIVEVYDKERNG